MFSALRARGIEADVYEQAPPAGRGRGGFYLALDSLRVLERLGLYDKVSQAGERFTGIEIWHADGTETAGWSPARVVIGRAVRPCMECRVMRGSAG